MTRHRLLKWILVIGALAPIALLVARAWAAAWPFPQLWPSAVDGSRVPDVSRIVYAMTVGVTLALLVGAVSTPLAFVVSRALARATAPVRTFGMAVAFLPVVAPPVSLGLGSVVLLMRLHLAGTFFGVALAHALPATGYATLFLVAVLDRYDFRAEEAARSLGATPWQVVQRVALPQLRPRLAEVFALCALVSWGQLALTQLVGEGAVRTLTLELLAFVQSGDDRLGALSALALTVPPLLLLGVLRRATLRTGVA